MFHISYLFQTNSGILWDFLNITDVEHLGIFLWSWYPIFIGLAGLMLLVSIIGSIINSQGMFYLNTQKRMYLKNKS
jgi:NADH:ubiquinone oxidoreductase subunit 6 (subunit J)